MKYGTLLEAIPYPVSEEEKQKERGSIYPNWLPAGRYRVATTKRNGFGLLVKTDRLPFWVNANWFRIVEN